MKFLKHRAVGSALLAGGCMLVFSLLYFGGPGEAGWARLWWQSALLGFVGFVMGLLPQSDDDDWPGKQKPPLVEPPFVVRATTGILVMSGVVGLLAAGGLLVSLMGLSGRFDDGTPVFYAAFGALCLWFMLMCLKTVRFTIEVHPRSLRIRSLLGWTEIPLAGVDRIEPRSFWFSFPAVSFSPIRALYWKDAEGSPRKMLLSLDPKSLTRGHSLLTLLTASVRDGPGTGSG